MKRRISKYACCLTIIILISIISSQISFSQILLSMAEMDAIIGTLSESDQEQFTNILLLVTSDPDQLTVDTINEFQSYLKIMGITKAKWNEFEYTIVESMGTYQVLLWEDIIKAIEKKRSYRSDTRWKHEQEHMELGLLTKHRWKENNKFMGLVASGIPINGILYDHDAALEILLFRRKAVQGLKRLFSVQSQKKHNIDPSLKY